MTGGVARGCHGTQQRILHPEVGRGTGREGSASLLQPTSLESTKLLLPYHIFILPRRVNRKVYAGSCRRCTKCPSGALPSPATPPCIVMLELASLCLQIHIPDLGTYYTYFVWIMSMGILNLV